ncbi:MAG: AraC family transcriptional regulator [Rikenellaceae bacterium]
MIIKEEKVTASGNNAFAFRSLVCRHFPSPLHFHPEMEVVYINQGDGLCFGADGITPFSGGDIFFFGANFSHYFRSDDRFYEPTSRDLCGSTYVQFGVDILPTSHSTMPGCSDILRLINHGCYGLKWPQGSISQQLADDIISMEYTNGFDRLIRLYKLLNALGQQIDKGEHIARARSSAEALASDYIYRKVMEYISLNFREEIALADLAKYVSMNSTALCRHFKSKTGYSIFSYLLDYRVGYAKQRLSSSQAPIAEIAYGSGFNNIPNFNVQFKRLTSLTPSQYRLSHAKGERE